MTSCLMKAIKLFATIVKSVSGGAYGKSSAQGPLMMSKEIRDFFFISSGTNEDGAPCSMPGGKKIIQI